MKNEALHVVLGSGQIGSLVADVVLARGGRVRMVRRGPAGAAREGLQWASGDLSDLAFARSVGEGASVVYDCTSPAYDAWMTHLLPLARGSMHAAATSGAKLVVLDNLYMYGRMNGPITESSPVVPCSRKGELRARLAEERAAAHARGDVRIATGRASDFFGPGVVRQTTFGERFYSRVFAGRSAQCFGDPDAPHSLSYAPDVARALVTLADEDEALGRVWHLPANPAESMRQTADRLASALGLRIRIARVPRPVLHVMGLFAPMVREVAEMAYQWDAPYILEDSRFRATFGGTSTPVEEIIPATARWASATFGRDGSPRAPEPDDPQSSAVHAGGPPSYS
jgi:nucleoside-diphosphate-sugar epimerase